MGPTHADHNRGTAAAATSVTCASAGSNAPATLYAEAIRANMNQWDPYGADDAPTDAEITAYLAQPEVIYNPATGLEQIHLQMWISLFSNANEAFSHWRRTGTPDLTPGPDLITPGGVIPVRFSYPSGEQSYNSANLGAAVSRQGAEWGSLAAGQDDGREVGLGRDDPAQLLAHDADLDRALIAVVLLHAEPPDAVLGTDRAAERHDDIVHDLVHARILGVDVSQNRTDQRRLVKLGKRFPHSFIVPGSLAFRCSADAFHPRRGASPR